MSESDAVAVVSWARGVHEEGAALRALGTRATKSRAEGVVERQIAHEVNKTLLDGLLSGGMTINIGEEGSAIFGHMEGNG